MAKKVVSIQLHTHTIMRHRVANNALRISSEPGGKQVCRRACMLNPLVVRREAHHGQWIYTPRVVGGREASGNNDYDEQCRLNAKMFQ